MNDYNCSIENEKPGVLVMVRLLDLISVYLGRTSEDIMKDHTYACKRLFSKILPGRMEELNKQKEELKTYVDKNDSCFKDEVLRLCDDVKIKSLVANILKNEKKQDEELLIDLLVPVSSRLELNHYNMKDVLRHYCNLFYMKSDEEAFKHFYAFLLRRDNYSKYFKKLFPQNKLKKTILYNEEYKKAKAEKCYKNYEDVIKRYQENYLNKM